MAVKSLSTRAKICGRSAKCKGGHSAVEQSGYISREKMYSEFDGKTYFDVANCDIKVNNTKSTDSGTIYILEGYLRHYTRKSTRYY